jgi:ABC-type transporter Mla maintaining outer membrane lipid asymmetry ATPase subunit MlaF
MTAAIELADVELRFGVFQVLDGISVAFPSGAASFIVGKAGSGKSSILKIAAGLVMPDRGKVSFRGVPLSRMGRAEETAFRRASAFAFQDAALWANQTIHQNLALPLAVHEPNLSKKEIDVRVAAAARRVGYGESLTLRPADLSAGEQKLVSLARALILDPELLFMDEPAASLDEDTVGRVSEIIGELRAAGKTIIAVSHRTRIIAEHADYLCLVADGKVTEFGPAGTVAKRMGGDLFKRLRSSSIDEAGRQP